MKKRNKPVPVDKWEWFGVAAHFCAANKCRFHLATRVGGYVISTVGLYFPGHGETQAPVGSDRNYETYVFVYGGMRECGGCVDLANLSQIDGVHSDTCKEANAAHMAMCKKWARYT